MLTYFWEQELIHYPDKEPVSWQEAIQESCLILLQKHIIDQSYVDEIIQCVETFGPYIIIAPEVAMPHSSEESAGVLERPFLLQNLSKQSLLLAIKKQNSNIIFYIGSPKSRRTSGKYPAIDGFIDDGWRDC